MRKSLLILTLLPALALAKPPMHGEAPFGDMAPPRHHHSMSGEDHLPRFLHKIDLTEKQKSEIKALVKAHHAEIETKLEDARKVGMEIHQVSFSNDYSESKVQSLLDKSVSLHQDIALHKSRIDNAIYKLLSAEQQEKVQQKMADFEH